MNGTIKKSLLYLAVIQLLSVSELHSQNLLGNPDFDSDLQSWSGGYWTPVWVSDGFFGTGAMEVTASGSVSIGGVALQQCVAVTVQGPHQLRVAYRESADSTQTGGAKLRVQWYAGANCTTYLNQVHDLDPVTGIQAWQVYFDNFVVPPAGTQSALVVLIQAVDAAGSYTATWDYLLFGPEAIFIDGFEAGNTTAWQ